MPDSLTALAMLALVGVPGYVYLTLVGRLREKSADGPTSLNLETVFFGLACGVTAALVSVLTHWTEWIDLVVAEPVDGSRDEASELLKDVLTVSTALFLQALLVAMAFAGIIRLTSADNRKERGRALALLDFAVGASVAVAIWI